MPRFKGFTATTIPVFLALWTLSSPPAGAGSRQGDEHIETPKMLWQRCLESLPPLQITVEKDQIVDSDSAPGTTLRRLQVKFYSQVIQGKKWGHPCVVFLPVGADPERAPQSRGRIVPSLCQQM